MKLKYKYLFSILTIILVLFLSCDKAIEPSNNPPDNPVTPSPHNPLPDEEAESMALWYGNELVADIDIYNRFRESRTLLRSLYRDTIPEVDIRFFLPFIPGNILAGLTDSAVTEFRNGTYHAWDSLNASFGMITIDTGNFFHKLPYVTIRFKYRLHSGILSTYYDTLPGVMHASANGYVGDRSNIYPWFQDDKTTFLVRKAWGDCPSGCINSHYYYFKQSDLSMEYIGERGPEDPAPDWWEEAKAALCVYRFGHADCSYGQ